MRPGFYRELNNGQIRPRATESEGTTQTEPEGDDEPFAGVAEWALMTVHGEPETLNEALEGENALDWSAAVENELKQIEKLHTWDIIEAPPGANVVKSRYVF
jgi:hypothetical protein